MRRICPCGPHDTVLRHSVSEAGDGDYGMGLEGRAYETGDEETQKQIE